MCICVWCVVCVCVWCVCVCVSVCVCVWCVCECLCMSVHVCEYMCLCVLGVGWWGGGGKTIQGRPPHVPSKGENYCAQ